MLWTDRKSTLFSLSIHQAEQGEPAKRKVKRVNIYQETEFLCPKLVFGYNKFMGGVGYNDQIWPVWKAEKAKEMANQTCNQTYFYVVLWFLSCI